MRAIVYEEYGAPEVLHLVELPKPHCGVNEILVKVMATAITAEDMNMRGYTYVPFGLKLLARMIYGYKQPKKQLLGNVFSGVVEEIGSEVHEFKVGDEVYGQDSVGLGSYAQYKYIASAHAVVQKPSNISHLEAASIPFGAITAKYFIDKAQIQAGDKVLVNGATGGTGLAAIQILKSLGANVTAIGSSKNIEILKSLGADSVIDDTQKDFHQNGILYDVIINTTVAKGDLRDHRPSLKSKGTYITVAGSLYDLLVPSCKALGGVKVISGIAHETKAILESINEMVVEGTLKPVVDSKVFEFEELPKAHEYTESAHKNGNVVVRVATI